MRNHSIAAILASAALVWSMSPAWSQDWMFRRSYYSHDESPGFTGGSVPDTRSAYRLPFVGNHPRFAIRGGYRYNSIILNNGISSDRTYIRENFFDVNY